ncbi:MAG TPA: glycosyltransferase [Solirubrobacteraceae bacterium]|nr:glycosyltransferase [Solirubrobacteraceae bacterium]
MAADNGDITAVVACFNYGAYLGEAVDSLLGQAGGAPRVVVVDDGSDDPATLATLDSLEERVELVRQPNRGVGAARNAGLERVETAYAIVLDADDRLAPGALAALRAPLDADAGLGFAYGTMRFFGDWTGDLRFPAYDPYALLYRHTIGLSALVRREVIAATGGFDPEFEQFEDWELWVNALAHGWRGRQVDAVTLEYRRHGATKLAADRGAYRRAFRRLRAKHAGLYADRARLAHESRLGPAGRAWYRAWWGARPVPARLERALHAARWRGARTGGDA